MASRELRAARHVRDAVRAAQASIYDDPVLDGDELYYSPDELDAILNDELVGITDLADVPVRTRSKMAKALVCGALGYVPPATFARVNPRLLHPLIDVYCQESNNLQIWNEEVDAARRYVILVIVAGVVREVKVIAGADLAQFDTTGTLTSKFQANRVREGSGSLLVSPEDTPEFMYAYAPQPRLRESVSPVAMPTPGNVLTISAVYERLLPLIGQTFADPGQTQERNRGTLVHRGATALLGLSEFADNGQFPDVLSQALEVKLQLARTIDLGLERPDSVTPVASLNGTLSVCDVRYAVFYGTRFDGEFEVTELVVTTGRDFFTEFRQFAGNVSNKKLQLRLPQAWFR